MHDPHDEAAAYAAGHAEGMGSDYGRRAWSNAGPGRAAYWRGRRERQRWERELAHDESRRRRGLRVRRPYGDAV